jgi:hypothetical protein
MEGYKMDKTQQGQDDGSAVGESAEGHSKKLPYREYLLKHCLQKIKIIHEKEEQP